MNLQPICFDSRGMGSLVPAQPDDLEDVVYRLQHLLSVLYRWLVLVK